MPVIKLIGAAMGLGVATAAAAAPALKCGFADDKMPACPNCLKAAMETGAFDFWWNWKASPEVDFSAMPQGITEKVTAGFVPMVWGNAAPLEGYGFLGTQSSVMGFNEPDMYGPACVGEWDPPVYGCPKGETRPATSAGWAPLFDPSRGSAQQPHAAFFWQQMVQEMTETHRPKVFSVGDAPRIVSPAMAGDAKGEASCIGVDPSQKASMKICHGWLQEFKRHALAMQCTDFYGRVTNCWDVLDAIQIHAYSRTASDVKKKIEQYYEVFREDFEGQNGRKKKTLWLTEVAMGSNDVAEIVPFVDALMNSEDGLTNRAKFWYVERVSWFSSFSFPSFKMGEYEPRKFEVWSSSLFNPFGKLSPVGERFFGLCKAGSKRRLDAEPGDVLV